MHDGQRPVIYISKLIRANSDTSSLPHTAPMTPHSPASPQPLTQSLSLVTVASTDSEPAESNEPDTDKHNTDSPPSTPPATGARREDAGPISSQGDGGNRQTPPTGPQDSEEAASGEVGMESMTGAVAAVASHGALYNTIAFNNIPHWVGVNTPIWNAYRVASEGGDSAAQTAAVLDLLLLPQRTLGRIGRGGRAALIRKQRIMQARCRDTATRMLQRYGSQPLIEPNGEQRTVTTESADENGDTNSQPVSRRTRSAATQQQTDEQDEESEADARAARRAQQLVSEKHIRKAAQALHSTTAMADLTDPAVQRTLAQLHPPLPNGAVIPRLPSNSPHVILQDDIDVRRLIRSSNNGSSAGPSGWGGNMLSCLVHSALCRGGIIALLKDISNGHLPEEARQLLLASRLVGLAKPDNGVRPIAIGELFYRLAAVSAARKATPEAAALLTPHQYGLGVAGGAEQLLHSLQHTLTDKSSRLAALKIDISNAFNSCNRAQLLQQLYSTRELSAIYRIVDFAYSAPTTLILQRTGGQTIQSTNGVRQGDPLSTLLFCLHMRNIYAQVAQKAAVSVYAYVDDLHVVGEPAEVIKALTAIKSALQAASLTCNTAKSHFAWFHDDDAPLQSRVKRSLAEDDVTVHYDWMEVVGAAIGRDEKAIEEGLWEVTDSSKYAAFFRRLQLDELPVPSAMLLLHNCMVPQLNYLLRCTPPPCIESLAQQFDERMLESAADKLDLTEEERNDDTASCLQARLKEGGFGLTSATLTSAGAYLGSVAAAHSTAALARYSSDNNPLPSDSLLHGWLELSTRHVVTRTPHSSEHLPTSAASFFQFYANSRSSAPSTLQRTLNTQASQHRFDASFDTAKEKGDRQLAHLKSITAPHAWVWKTVMPISSALILRDQQYRVAARLNLGLDPVKDMDVPDKCHACNKSGVFNNDHWHRLSCKAGGGAGINHRHHAVNNALYEAALLLGGQAAKEVKGLAGNSRLRPDLQMVFHGEHLLSDVMITHPLAPSQLHRTARGRPLAQSTQRAQAKHIKYREVARQHRAIFLPFVAETYGGLTPAAVQLVERMARAGQQQVTMWTDNEVKQHIMAHVAIAIQRFTAMTVLAGDASMRMTTSNGSEQQQERAEEKEQERVLERRSAEEQQEESEDDE
jgi:hypothetical protein